MRICEIRRVVNAIEEHCDCIAWKDFTDKIYYSAQLSLGLISENHMLWIIRSMIIPYGSEAHIRLCGKVSQATGNHHVTYDFLTKALSRLLCLGTAEELTEMLELSDAVKTRMREKGLFTIQSLADVFPEDEKLFGYCGV